MSTSTVLSPGQPIRRQVPDVARIASPSMPFATMTTCPPGRAWTARALERRSVGRPPYCLDTRSSASPVTSQEGCHVRPPSSDCSTPNRFPMIR